jgi:hypothetical protein
MSLTVTIPAKSLIFVLVFEKTTSGSFGFIADGNNGYGVIGASFPNNSTTNGSVQTLFAFNSVGLSGGTLTYTKATSGVFASMSALYATGIQTTSNPRDSASENTTTGNSAFPSVTSNAFLTTGELVVAALAWAAGGGDSFTQATDGPYAAPPALLVTVGNANAIAGGNLVRATTTAIGYNPGILNVRPWVAMITAFQPAPPPPPPPDATTFIAVGNY